MSCYYCLLDLRSGECNVVSLYVLCCPVNGSVGFVCCVFDGVCELFSETIRNMFGCVQGTKQALTSCKMRVCKATVKSVHCSVILRAKNCPKHIRYPRNNWPGCNL